MQLEAFDLHRYDPQLVKFGEDVQAMFDKMAADIKAKITELQAPKKSCN